jgi:hypothetical protein
MLNLFSHRPDEYGHSASHGKTLAAASERAKYEMVTWKRLAVLAVPADDVHAGSGLGQAGST